VRVCVCARAFVELNIWNATFPLRLQDSQFTKFMAHYKKTEAKEADYARRMRKRMADEKLDEQEVCVRCTYASLRSDVAREQECFRLSPC